MSDDTKDLNEAPKENLNEIPEDSTASDNVTKDTVKYETYSRNLSKLKKTEARLKDYEDKLNELTQKDLERDGKKDELIEQLRKEKAELSNKFNSAIGNVARSNALTSIVDEAVKLGCTSTKLLTKVVEGDLADLDYGDDYKPDREQVKALVERVKADEPVLFSKAAPKIKDGIPKTPDLDEKQPTSVAALAHKLAELNRM